MAREQVLCALSGEAELRAVAEISRSEQFEVTRRCVDLTELLAAAEAGVAQIAVVHMGLRGLDRTSVDRLRSSGVRVVLVADDDPESHIRAGRLGAHLTMAAQESVVSALTLSESAGQDPDAGLTRLAENTPSQRDAGGQILAVWGPYGAPGRTTAAIGVAHTLAQREPGLNVLLADADTYGASVAQSLAILDDVSGLAAAARSADLGDLDVVRLSSLAPVVDDFRVLTGIARPEQWPELSSAALEVVWERCRELVPWTVIDAGFNCERDEWVSQDTHTTHRNAATMSALTHADHILAIGRPDPIGLTRLLNGLDTIRDITSATPVTIAINGVDDASAGPRATRTIGELLGSHAQTSDYVLIPYEHEVVSSALLTGNPVTKGRHSEPIAEAIFKVTDRICHSPVPH